MKWLITGGCGFIGTNLANALIKMDKEVLIIDNFCTAHPENIKHLENLDIKIIAADVSKKESFDGLNADIVVHLAAHAGVLPSFEDPLFDCMNNIIATLNALQFSEQQNAKFIMASSGAVLGDNDPPVNEKMVPKPLSPYGVSKNTCEQYCYVYNKTYNLHSVVLRFSNVYGPWSRAKKSIVAKFIKQKQDFKALTIYGEGNQTRDFIYVENVVDAIIKSTEKDVGGQIFHISTGMETSILQVAQLISPNISHIESQPEVQRNYADSSKAQKLLGWKPKTSPKDGLNKTIQWFIPKPPPKI